MMDNIRTVLLVLAGVAILGWYFHFYFSRSRSLIEKWAEDNEYQLLQAECRLFRRGPFFFSSKGQAIYRVAVLDEQGRNREAWMRCGHWLLGLAVEHVQVKWDG